MLDSRRNHLNNGAPCEDSGHSKLTVDVLRGGVEVIDSLEAEWLNICDQRSSDQWFQRPEFSRAYMRNFAAGREVVVFTLREAGGRLVAVLPLYREKKWIIPGLFAVWKLRGPSMVDGFPFDLIVASKEEAECAAKALWRAVDKFPGWNILELPNVAEGGAAEKLTRAAALAGAAVFPWAYMRTPFISLGDWDGENALRLARSKNLRHTLKRVLNTEGEKGIQLRRVESAADAFSQFFALESRSWKGKANRTVAGCEKLRKFYMEIAEAAERFGYLAFYFLDVGGVTVASRFALTYRGHYGELECVHDEKYKEHAPGHLIIAEILSDCAKRGFRDVELSGHTSEYKERWTSRFRPHTYWFIYRRGILGRLLYLAKTCVKPMITRTASTVRRALQRP